LTSPTLPFKIHLEQVVVGSVRQTAGKLDVIVQPEAEEASGHFQRLLVQMWHAGGTENHVEQLLYVFTHM